MPSIALAKEDNIFGFGWQAIQGFAFRNFCFREKRRNLTNDIAAKAKHF
jgi:hypothetical protein